MHGADIDLALGPPCSPEASFAAGYVEGQITLDSIRGILASEGLPSDTQIGFYGYSGGAHTTAWAASLSGQYAPELNIVGASYGGTPVDPEHLLTSLSGGLFSGFGLAGLVGISSAYDELEALVMQHATAQGNKTIARIKESGTCVGQVVLEFPLLDVFGLADVPNLLQLPTAQKYLKKETLLASKASYDVPVPRFPRLIYHALFDEIVPFNDSQGYIKEQCAANKGANIQSLVLPIAEHLTGEVLGIPTAIAFLDKAFKGTTPDVVCGTVVPQKSVAEVSDLLGADLTSQLQSLRSTGKLQTSANLEHSSSNNATGITS